MNSEYKGLLADNPGANTESNASKMNQDEAVWSAGQAMGLIDDIPTCKELIENIVEEAAIALGELLYWRLVCKHTKNTLYCVCECVLYIYVHLSV